MKNPWMKAVFLTVAMALSACGGTQETPDEALAESGDVEQMLPQCDEEGQCPTGFYCAGGPGSTCRRGVVAMPYQCTTEGLCPKGYYCDGGPGGICRRELSLAE
ncbi:hypothetical protein [Melittangium boletus]|uniref:Lipoprotein n=1 Tax=Melittangium boletus DSM 14713 TaxID=1294270 RepID=A0A250I929_9BACT|nr:hypothetical protein [Melittangium boletus]ATB28374.1 hypothetical protein MEBOL_001820 [Melittangium boletus DSM 14713]